MSTNEWMADDLAKEIREYGIIDERVIFVLSTLRRIVSYEHNIAYQTMLLEAMPITCSSTSKALLLGRSILAGESIVYSKACAVRLIRTANIRLVCEHKIATYKSAIKTCAPKVRNYTHRHGV